MVCNYICLEPLQQIITAYARILSGSLTYCNTQDNDLHQKHYLKCFCLITHESLGRLEPYPKLGRKQVAKLRFKRLPCINKQHVPDQQQHHAWSQIQSCSHR